MSGKVELAVINLDDSCGMYGIVIRLDIQCSAADIHESDCVVVVVFSVKRVFICLDVDRAVCDPYRIICFEGVRGACDIDRTARNLEIIFACDTVISRLNRQRSCSVQHQVVFAEDYGISIGIAVRSKSTGHCERVLGSGRSHKYLVRALDIDTGCTVICDRYAIQDNLHFILITRIDDDRSVPGRSCDHINAFRCDLNSLYVCYCVVLRLAEVRLLLQISAREHVGGFQRSPAHHAQAGCRSCVFCIVCSCHDLSCAFRSVLGNHCSIL